MGNQNVRGAADAEFARAARAIAGARLRSEMHLTEVPAPTRVAPYALALTCDVMDPQDAENELATGRFVLLHDPSCPEPWDGAWRAVTFGRAALEPEFAGDPLLSDMGWTWLTESLDAAGVSFTATAATVTCVSSQGYGSLAQDGASIDMEIRASWTPTDDAAAAHFLAWANLLCTMGGLPPLPEGVVALPGPRR